MFPLPFSPNANHVGFNILFERMGHDCDPQYLKPTILAAFGTLRLAKKCSVCQDILVPYMKNR